MQTQLEALIDLSARIGADPTLVQGPGGNTSLKDGETLLVKGSGTWLAEARERDIFARLDLPALRDALAEDDDRLETCEAFLLPGSALRPSIETTLHAVLPHTVVVHVHCVETIAAACRTDAEPYVRAALADLDDVTVAIAPYARPGRPLTRAVLAAMVPATNVIVLRNHGLVVGADTVEEAEALQAKVTASLAVTPRTTTGPDFERLTRLAHGSAYVPAELDAHRVATDEAALSVAVRGSLYPDHVIFLGRALRTVEDAAALAALKGEVPAVAVPGAGLLVRQDATPGTRALALGLALVCCRLRSEDPLDYLSAGDEDALLNWDAEAFRAKLDRGAGEAP